MPALVIEGGGSRATYATGVCASLQAAGFVPDAVYGTSAGGALAAWYGAGQAERAVHTWVGVLDKRLLSYRRLVLPGHVLDLHRLYREHYTRVFGFDVDALKKAPFPVHVTLTDAQTAATYYPDIRKADEPLWVVHAGAALPIVAEAPVEWNGRPCLDGGATVPIPLAKAIEDGHRDIVCVLNRPPGVRGPEPALAVRLVARRFPALAEATAQHHEHHNEAVRLAESPPPGVRVRIVRPSADTGVSRMSRDLVAITRAIERGRRDGRRVAAELGLTGVRPRLAPR